MLQNGYVIFAHSETVSKSMKNIFLIFTDWVFELISMQLYTNGWLQSIANMANKLDCLVDQKKNWTYLTTQKLIVIIQISDTVYFLSGYIHWLSNIFIHKYLNQHICRSIVRFLTAPKLNMVFVHVVGIKYAIGYWCVFINNWSWTSQFKKAFFTI